MCSLTWGKVLFDPPRGKSYCQFSEGTLFGLFGTGVTVAKLSGYAKQDECSSYRPLAYAQNRQHSIV